MRGAEVGERAQDRPFEIVDRKPDAQPRHRAAVRRHVEHLIVEREDAPRVVDDHLALCGERHARRALVEQLRAEQHLQALDLRAHRRLRDAERLRGAGEAAQIRDCDEGSQQIRRHVDHHPPQTLQTAATIRCFIYNYNQNITHSDC